MSKKAAEHHKKASEHLTHAARHHGEAAKHHDFFTGAEWPAQRLIFPCLNIASRPVVEEAVTCDMIAGGLDIDRLTQGVAATDPDPKLQLVVQTFGGPHDRC